jgi:hypothetical protein
MFEVDVFEVDVHGQHWVTDVIKTVEVTVRIENGEVVNEALPLVSGLVADVLVVFETSDVE